MHPQVFFGRHDWDMPLMARPHPDASHRYAAFAAALLAGEVLPCMAVLAPVLSQPPAAAARHNERTQPRVGELLAALATHQVPSQELNDGYNCQIVVFYVPLADQIPYE